MAACLHFEALNNSINFAKYQLIGLSEWSPFKRFTYIQTHVSLASRAWMTPEAWCARTLKNVSIQAYMPSINKVPSLVPVLIFFLIYKPMSNSVTQITSGQELMRRLISYLLRDMMWQTLKHSFIRSILFAKYQQIPFSHEKSFADFPYVNLCKPRETCPEIIDDHGEWNAQTLKHSLIRSFLLSINTFPSLVHQKKFLISTYVHIMCPGGINYLRGMTCVNCVTLL